MPSPVRGPARPLFRSLFIVLGVCLPVLVIPGIAEGKDVLPRVTFEKIVVEKKLSQHGIQSILQDKKGFIWVGTQGGLNRFDGYGFTSFRHQPFTSDTLSDNYIRDFLEDENGIMWIATRGGGLNRFDPGTGRFSHYLPQSGNTRSISSANIFCLHLDRQGRLWIGTIGGGLCLLDRSSMTFTRYIHNASNPSGLSSNRIVSLAEDSSGYIWVGTEGGGLNRFDPATGAAVVFRHKDDDPGSLAGDCVWSIYEDKKGTLWVGTCSGLDKYDKDQNRFFHYRHDPSDPHSLSHPLVSEIIEGGDGRLWIGTGTSNTIGRGLNIFDPGTGTFYRQPLGKKHKAGEPLAVCALLRDKTGIIWLGSLGDGLYKYVPHKHRFPVCLYGEDQHCGLPGSRVWALYETSDRKLWVSTLGSGLNCWDRRTDTWTSYTHRPGDENSLINNSVRAILEDADGILWVGTDGGLDKLNRRTGVFSHYQESPGSIHRLSSNDVSCLAEGPLGFIWVGTWGGGLNRLDKSTGRFTHFPFQPGNPRSLSGDKVTTIFFDFNRRMWVGTASKGLNRWDPKQKRFIHYLHDMNDETTISSNVVMSLYQDTPATLWVGTWGGGLNKLDIEKGTFVNYVYANAPTNSSIMGLLGDKKHNLWMSTTNGLFKFEPVSKLFTNYTEDDGLQGDEFNQDSYHLSPSGEMFFGGTNGFNYFYPENIKTNTNVPVLALTDFKIFGQSVPVNKWNKSHIRLDYWQNHFSFEFTALEYTNPNNNRYAYKMEGFDTDWIFCGVRRHATYTNLDGGEYVFRVMGSNSDGIWNTAGLFVKITVTPPYWQTLWFRLLLGGILTGAVLILFLLRTRNLRRELFQQEKFKRKLQHSRDQLQKAKDLVEFQHAEVLQLVAAISSILIAVDSKGDVYEWNTPAERFFDLQREDVIGKPFTEVLAHCIKPRDLEDLLRPYPQQEGNGDNSREIDLEINFKDNYRLLGVVVNPIFDKKDKYLGFLLICEDMTDRRAEESRKNLLLKLKSIGQMHAGISHQINSPLLYIRVNSQTISRFLQELEKSYLEFKAYLDGLPEGAGKKAATETWKVFAAEKFDRSLRNALEATQMIEEGNRQVMEVVKAMKEFFHPGNPQMEFCDINELLTSTLIVCGHELRNIADIETHFDESLPLVSCFPAQLNQVFLNLVGNAADAVEETGEEGKITINTRVENNSAVIEIGDTGTGIAEDVAEKIFSPFFTTKRKGIGTGMGLSMTKKIIEENHGGRIYFKSSSQGTTFFVHLNLG